jgi:purine-nucleoside phosphorylase
MNDYRHKVLQTTEFLTARIEKKPEIALMTGTGLAGCVDAVVLSASFRYDDVLHFPAATVESHTGKLLFGDMAGKPVVVMQGRFHLYEGYSPLEVTFPIRVFQHLGVKCLIISNAAGGINPEFKAGDIMIITDHINLTGENPLIGIADDRWGLRFPDMSAAYSAALAAVAEQAGKNSGWVLRKGVYGGLKGPSLETPAEIRFLKTIGADAVGFSTIQEVIVAVQAGMKVLGLSTITNTHDPDNPVPAKVEHIIGVAEATVPKLAAVIEAVIESMPLS